MTSLILSFDIVHELQCNSTETHIPVSVESVDVVP